MKKSYSEDCNHDQMRLDRWIRNNLGKIPQGLIEKNLRKGKIKVNNKKVTVEKYITKLPGPCGDSMDIMADFMLLAI